MSGPPALDPGFSTPEMSAVFSSTRTVSALCEFEAALALALGDAGLAPREEAEAVAKACRAALDQPDDILATTWEAGTPLIAVTAGIRARLADDRERRWVHHGATTQDAVDTARMLQARQGLHILGEHLVTIARHMKDLVDAHRHQPHMGRTFLQLARPTTFGLRAAMWLEPTLRHIQAVREARSGLVIQLGGPVGNLAGYGDQGTEVATALAGRLGLKMPDISWHSDRSRVTSLAQVVERASNSTAKVASDVALLAQSDIAEVKVRGGRSSSMPEKRNPIDAVRAIAAAEVVTGATAMVMRGARHELDRAVGGWHVEWLAVPLLFHAAAAVMQSVETCLETLEVDGARMASRVDPGDMPDIDPRQIERVLSTFEQIIGGT